MVGEEHTTLRTISSLHSSRNAIVQISIFSHRRGFAKTAREHIQANASGRHFLFRFLATKVFLLVELVGI